ncbi:hypothetical protein [Rarobacter incanus]|uniref:Uncharacterized protein n=1 Tax=Rarobacter incanus TaxID=153494 RepID=A0A542SRJ5_9MICO|nr:hypothetical protein [Rarobacter incanus]TQK77208.1 hypothetical protein FB389_1924 [Rarobacter incanus]
MSTLDEIITACGDQVVCQFRGATVSDPAQVAADLPAGARVIVIPELDQAETTMSANELAAGVRAADGATTVIVIESRAGIDRFGVATAGDAKAIQAALNSQRLDDGGQAVASIAATIAPARTADADAGGGLSGAVGGIIAGVLGVVVIGAVGAIAIEAAHRRRKRSTAQAGVNRRLDRQLHDALDGRDGELVLEAIERLEERARALPALTDAITSLRRHVAELFVRVRRRGTDQQIRLLQVQYKDTLTKLLSALADDYYADIARNPEFWSNPRDRMAEVERAIGSVDRQALDNIRQVNESRDLEFKVALDSLNQTVDQARLSDVYKDRADGH